MSTYDETFQRVLDEVRKIPSVSDIERWDNYEALKSKVYELLNAGRSDLGKASDEAVAWLRQQVQIRRSEARLYGRSLSAPEG